MKDFNKKIEDLRDGFEFRVGLVEARYYPPMQLKELELCPFTGTPNIKEAKGGVIRYVCPTIDNPDERFMSTDIGVIYLHENDIDSFANFHFAIQDACEKIKENLKIN